MYMGLPCSCWLEDQTRCYAGLQSCGRENLWDIELPTCLPQQQCQGLPSLPRSSTCGVLNATTVSCGSTITEDTQQPTKDDERELAD